MFSDFSPAAVEGGGHFGCEVRSVSPAPRPAVSAFCHRDILNTTGAWVLDPEVLKDHNYHAGRLGGCLGFYFGVGEGFPLQEGAEQ